MLWQGKNSGLWEHPLKAQELASLTSSLPLLLSPTALTALVSQLFLGQACSSLRVFALALPSAMDGLTSDSSSSFLISSGLCSNVILLTSPLLLFCITSHLCPFTFTLDSVIWHTIRFFVYVFPDCVTTSEYWCYGGGGCGLFCSLLYPWYPEWFLIYNRFLINVSRINIAVVEDVDMLFLPVTFLKYISYCVSFCKNC